MNTGWAKNCTFSIRYIDGTVQDKMVFTKMFREHKRPNTRWKARVKFLLSVIELLILSLTVEALQGKMCQDSLLSGEGRSVRDKISGGRGHPWGIFFGFYKTRHILLYDSANCTVLRAAVLIQYRRVTDRQTKHNKHNIYWIMAARRLD